MWSVTLENADRPVHLASASVNNIKMYGCDIIEL